MQELNEERELVPVGSGALAEASESERARAQIQAAYMVAMKRPRSLAEARSRLLAACKRSTFADAAIYERPVGGGQNVQGPSIRLAEEAAKSYGNIIAGSGILYENERGVQIRVWATDLETNLTHAVEAWVERTVERRNPRGRKVLGERINSSGQTVYLVEANELEMRSKIFAEISKLLRTVLLRLLPFDYVEEAVQTCLQVKKAEIAQDPAAAYKRLADRFQRLGIRPTDLEAYTGKPLQDLTPDEIVSLEGLANALEQGEVTWDDVLASTDQGPEQVADARREALKSRLQQARNRPQSQEEPKAGDGSLFQEKPPEAPKKASRGRKSADELRQRARYLVGAIAQATGQTPEEIIQETSAFESEGEMVYAETLDDIKSYGWLVRTVKALEAHLREIEG